MFVSSVYVMYHIKIIGCETSSSLLKSTLLLLCVVSFFFIEFLQWITTEWVTLLILSHLFSYKISCLQMMWHILKKKSIFVGCNISFYDFKSKQFCSSIFYHLLHHKWSHSYVFWEILQVMIVYFHKSAHTHFKRRFLVYFYHFWPFFSVFFLGKSKTLSRFMFPIFFY